MIPTQKLHHVVVLADQRNYRRAADILHLTQPALSRSITSIERTLGVRLFDRGRGGVKPTGLGKLFVERARTIVSAIAELEHEIDLAKGLRAGTLEVSLARYPSALSVQRAVARLLATYPEIQCRVRVAGFHEVADDVAQGRCDLDDVVDYPWAAIRAPARIARALPASCRRQEGSRAES